MSVKELSHSELLLLPQFPQVPLSRQAFELDCLRSFLFTREPHKFRSLQLYFSLQPYPSPGVVACSCNPTTFMAEFQNGVDSIPVGSNSLSIGGCTVQPPAIQQKSE